MQVFDSAQLVASHEFIGVVRSYDPLTKRAVVEMRNRFAAGERLEMFGPKTECREFVVTDLRNADGEPIREAVRVQEHVSLAMQDPVEEYAIVRRRLAQL